MLPDYANPASDKYAGATTTDQPDDSKREDRAKALKSKIMRDELSAELQFLRERREFLARALAGYIGAKEEFGDELDEWHKMARLIEADMENGLNSIKREMAPAVILEIVRQHVQRQAEHLKVAVAALDAITRDGNKVNEIEIAMRALNVIRGVRVNRSVCPACNKPIADYEAVIFKRVTDGSGQQIAYHHSCMPQPISQSPA